MPRLRPILAVVAALALPLALGGCPLAIVSGLGAAGGAGYAANQERGVGGSIDDLTIKTNIQNAWGGASPALQGDLNVTVYEGRTLLTGAASNPQTKAQAKEIASHVAGVRVVYDEIEVMPGGGTWQGLNDAWITTRLRSDLTFNGEVRSLNYTIETVNQSVYLIGSARTQAELDRVVTAARYTPGVKRVVSYVEIRPGAPVAAQSSAPAPLGPPASLNKPALDAPAAAPVAPVEVQKL